MKDQFGRDPLGVDLLGVIAGPPAFSYEFPTGSPLEKITVRVRVDGEVVCPAVHVQPAFGRSIYGTPVNAPTQLVPFIAHGQVLLLKATYEHELAKMAIEKRYRLCWLAMAAVIGFCAGTTAGGWPLWWR